MSSLLTVSAVIEKQKIPGESSSIRTYEIAQAQNQNCANRVYNIAKTIIGTLNKILKNNDAFVNLVKLMSTQFDLAVKCGVHLSSSVVLSVTETCKSYITLGSLKNVVNKLDYFASGEWLVKSPPDGGSFLLRTLGNISFAISDLIGFNQLITEKRILPVHWEMRLHSLPVLGMALKAARGPAQVSFGVLGFGFNISNTVLKLIRNPTNRTQSLLSLVGDVARLSSIILMQFALFPCKVFALLSSSLGNIVYLTLALHDEMMKKAEESAQIIKQAQSAKVL